MKTRCLAVAGWLVAMAVALAALFRPAYRLPDVLEARMIHIVKPDGSLAITLQAHQEGGVLTFWSNDGKPSASFLTSDQTTSLTARSLDGPDARAVSVPLNFWIPSQKWALEVEP
jgi:hypothetical protein